MKALDFEDIFQIAKDMFDEKFDFKIRNLLHVFPADNINSQGVLFWSGPKRLPSPVTFDPFDRLHLQFVSSAANLLAYSIGMQYVRDTTQHLEMARACKPGVYVPKKVKVELGKNDKSVTQPKEEEPEEEEEDDEVVLKRTVDALNVIAKDF